MVGLLLVILSFFLKHMGKNKNAFKPPDVLVLNPYNAQSFEVTDCIAKELKNYKSLMPPPPPFLCLGSNIHAAYVLVALFHLPLVVQVSSSVEQSRRCFDLNAPIWLFFLCFLA